MYRSAMKCLPVSIASCLLTASLSAQTRGGFDVDWNTVDCGGAMHTAGGSFELAGTIGQPDAGAMTGGAFELFGGFWPGASARSCPEDLDHDGDIDIQDLAFLLSSFGTFGSGPVGDIDADNDVDLQDLAFLLAVFGATCQ